MAHDMMAFGKTEPNQATADTSTSPKIKLEKFKSIKAFMKGSG